MKITLEKSINPKNSLLVIPLFEDGGSANLLPKQTSSLAGILKKEKDFKGKEAQSFSVTPLLEKLPKHILFLGMGKEKKLSATSARDSAARAVTFAKNHKSTTIEFILSPTLGKFLQELAEGFILANYNPARFQTGESKKKHLESNLKSIAIITSEKDKKSLQKGQTIAQAVNAARDLVNAPHNLMDTEILTREAGKIARENKLKITILNKKQLEKLKMGALLGVNKGSAKGANLVIMEHKPATKSAKNSKPIILVGKGITFDSGGYNLKSGPWFADMKMDMSGAAVVMQVMALCSKLEIPHHIIGITPITDNLIDQNAQKVCDIVTSYSGKTIEVNNTDAEGRLVLCDAISYSIEKYNPRMLIDIATLTGACVMALGEKYAGLFGNNQTIMDELKKAGERTGELTWHMPIHPDHSKEMKSRIADLQNVNYGNGGMAGASTAAAFLKEFVGKTDWAHLDIAGTSFVKHPKKYEHQMATGYGVRLLVNFLENL